jgi:hypothetical protein
VITSSFRTTRWFYAAAQLEARFFVRPAAVLTNDSCPRAVDVDMRRQDGLL